MSDKKAHFAVIRSAYRKDIVDKATEGAVNELEKAGATYDYIEASGSLEIPGVVAILKESKDVSYDGYVVLGCIIKGETIHDEVIAYTVFSALDEMVRQDKLALGNGVLTVNTVDQAIERADPAQQNRGGEAAKAALHMWKLKQTYL